MNALRGLAKRVGRAEGRDKPPVAIPNVLHVRRGETIDEALARFGATYPNPPRQHRLLVVPERDRTDEDNADFERRFKAQQLKSQADARSANPKEATI